MRKVLVLLNLFLLFAFTGCVGKKYTAPNFDVKTTKHRQIAILPFEIVYTGKQPNNLTADDIAKLRDAEGLAFQKSLYDNILSQTGSGKKDIKIEMQPIEKTNKLLQDSGLTYLALSTTVPEEICKKLGVDAVVFSTIEKERFLSDLESFGISITKDVLDKLRKNNPVAGQTLPEIPGNVARTYHIKSDCRLKNGEDGALLWKYSVETDTDWQTPANNLITMINKKSSKKFPYRNHH